MRAFTIAMVIGLTVGLLIQTCRYAKLRTRNQQVERSLVELQKQSSALQVGPAPAAGREMLNEERLELLRLRNQAQQLRATTNELHRQLRAYLVQPAPAALTKSAATPAPVLAGELVQRDTWSFAGYATPEAAFQSTILAHSQGDHHAFLASLTGQAATMFRKDFDSSKTPEEFTETLREETSKITGYRILDTREVSPDETVLVIYYSGTTDLEPVLMRKVGHEWRLAGHAPDQ